MTCLISVWTVLHSVNCQAFSFCVHSIRNICDVVAPTGMVGYAQGFTGSIKVVAHAVSNKEG